MDDKCLTTYPVVNSFTTTSYSCSIIARPISDSTASNTSRFAETPHPNSIHNALRSLINTTVTHLHYALFSSVNCLSHTRHCLWSFRPTVCLSMDQTASLYRPRRLTFLPRALKTFHQSSYMHPPAYRPKLSMTQSRHFLGKFHHATTTSLCCYIITCPPRASFAAGAPPLLLLSNLSLTRLWVISPSHGNFHRISRRWIITSQLSLIHAPLSHQPFSWKFPFRQPALNHHLSVTFRQSIHHRRYLLIQ